MRRRILCFFLAGLGVLGCMLSCLPVRAGAIVPLGLVQSALASYVASAGYKLWNDNGTGQEILKSLSDLYDGPFLAFAESSLGVNIEVNDLSYYAANDMVYQDTSGQIVIRKAAADMFQEFADWIQTEYSVPVGSDIPTEVVTQTIGGFTFPDYQTSGDVVVSSVVSPSFLFDWSLSQSDVSYTFSSSVQSAISSFLSDHANDAVSIRIWTNKTGYGGWSPITFYAVTPGSLVLNVTRSSCLETYGSGGASVSVSDFRLSTQNFGFIGYRKDSSFVSVSNVDASTIPGVSGLAVTLAQAVADVVGQAKEDDAVVIGVGAGVGATAQDIADMVAQGVKAQTLNPSVSITAESVIDTPVQPYPDIDGLGLPQLGAALVERFPFCIPWDFVDTLRLFSADPQPINIKVDLIPQRIKTSVGITSDTSFDIDLSGEQYAKIGVFCRWGSLITFCFGLFLITKRLVWTA